MAERKIRYKIDKKPQNQNDYSFGEQQVALDNQRRREKVEAEFGEITSNLKSFFIGCVGDNKDLIAVLEDYMKQIRFLFFNNKF